MVSLQILQHGLNTGENYCSFYLIDPYEVHTLMPVLLYQSGTLVKG